MKCYNICVYIYITVVRCTGMLQTMSFVVKRWKNFIPLYNTYAYYYYYYCISMVYHALDIPYYICHVHGDIQYIQQIMWDLMKFSSILPHKIQDQCCQSNLSDTLFLQLRLGLSLLYFWQLRQSIRFWVVLGISFYLFYWLAHF